MDDITIMPFTIWAQIEHDARMGAYNYITSDDDEDATGVVVNAILGALL